MRTYRAWSPAHRDAEVTLPHELRVTHAADPRQEAVALLDAVSRKETWMGRAICQGVDPDLWFGGTERPDWTALARKTCHACPVRSECLAYAKDLHAAGTQLPGVWAGTTRAERDRTWNRRTA